MKYDLLLAPIVGQQLFYDAPNRSYSAPQTLLIRV